VDAGLADLDAPIGDYLHEFANRPAKGKITLRHLFTHTAGFDTYGEWGIDYNHSFENAAALYLPYMEPGKQYSYDGNGYALAGKIMERLSGKCIPYLFQENLFGPLGCTRSSSDNCHGSCMSTCMDMARVAQMLLQKGKYGPCQFFSEPTFEKMLPCSLAKTVGLEMEHGIGLERADPPLLGHAAMSGAVFRIWPEKQLLIISARYREGPRYEEFTKQLRLACKAPFLTSPTAPPAAKP
jgi:CubicO group peptidase (beta-lactamase class C family)